MAAFLIVVLILLIICGLLPFYRPALGFITGIVFSVVFLVIGLVVDKIELAGVSPILFLLTVAVTAFTPKSEYASWPRKISRWILTICLLIIFSLIGLLIMSRGGSFGLLFVVMFISSVIGAMITSEMAKATFVITTIGSSMRQNLPLTMALEMTAAGRKDKRGEILRNIKKWLIEGYPLSEAMKRGYPRCPASVSTMVAAGEKIGQVPQAIAALEQDLVARAHKNKKVRHFPTLYPPLILFMIFIVVVFLMVIIMPKFQEILKYYLGENMHIPAAMNILMRISEFTRSNAAGVIGLLLAFLALFGGIIYIRVKTRPRRPQKPYIVSRIGDFIKWHIPFFRFYEWTNSMQRVAGMLRLSLTAGCTVNESITNTVELDVNNCFRKNLKRWLVKVEQGGDIGQSAGQCGLGSGIIWAFTDSSNHGNTLAVLDTLETSYRWAYSRAAGLVWAIIGPCETICLGFMVGFILYAVFSTMIAITTAVGSFVP